MATTLDHFDVLTDKGLQVIPLRANSKVPMYRGWNRDWNRRQARESVLRFPECNLGILLGDIVDVEGDSPEANETIQRLVGDYPHPTYQSTRSVHHLFRTPDPELRIFKHNEIEFRGIGHQSVLPPSRHLETIYRWMKQPCFPVPAMPESLVGFYKSKQSKHKVRIKKDHTKVTCGVCQRFCFMHKTRFHLELEAFQLLDLPWTCQSCREIDLRPVVRILRREMKQGAFEHKIGSSWSDFSSLALSVTRAKIRAA